MGEFSPVLVEQILLTWRYLPVHGNEYRVGGNVIEHFRSHYVRSCRIYSCKQHIFIKLHQVTNARKSVLIVSRMSFCTKGIHTRSCRIQYLAKRRKTFSSREKVPVRADEGWWKILIPGPNPPSATVPPLPEGEGSWLDHGFCDSALRLRAEWQEWSFWKYFIF